MASIWLLDGNATASVVRNCDAAATKPFGSLAQKLFSAG
jgi:hypothetical protein